jgi:hypothetical protein
MKEFALGEEPKASVNPLHCKSYPDPILKFKLYGNESLSIPLTIL